MLLRAERRLRSPRDQRPRELAISRSGACNLLTPSLERSPRSSSNILLSPMNQASPIGETGLWKCLRSRANARSSIPFPGCESNRSIKSLVSFLLACRSQRNSDRVTPRHFVEDGVAAWVLNFERTNGRCWPTTADCTRRLWRSPISAAGAPKQT
jgi:hypothetical protein